MTMENHIDPLTERAGFFLVAATLLLTKMPAPQVVEEFIVILKTPRWFAVRLVEVAQSGHDSEAEQQEYIQDFARAESEMASAEVSA